VAPGGQLIYATCSVLGPENEAVVADFLEHHPAFALEPLAQRLGPRAAAVGGELLRMTPQGHGGDGFFAATLRRH
jgi:16S rRNA (cytosine967-C5)-methyltransferase